MITARCGKSSSALLKMFGVESSDAACPLGATWASNIAIENSSAISGTAPKLEVQCHIGGLSPYIGRVYIYI